MAVRRIAQRFERAALSALPTALPTPRCVTTHAERSVPELAAIFEAGAGRDAEAFLRCLRARNARSPTAGQVQLTVVKLATEKERRVVQPEPALLGRDLYKLSCPVPTLSLEFSTTFKECVASLCSAASTDDDEGSVASSLSTEPASDNESGSDGPLQVESEPKQPVVTLMPPLEQTSSTPDHGMLATNEPVPEVVETTLTVPAELTSDAPDHDGLATNEPGLDVVEPMTETTRMVELDTDAPDHDTLATNEPVNETAEPMTEMALTAPVELISGATDHGGLATNEPIFKTLNSAASTAMPIHVPTSTATVGHDFIETSEPAAIKALEPTIVTPTTPTTKTLTATAPTASSPSPASSRSRASSRPRLNQKLQPPSVLPSRSPPSSSAPSSIPARERTRSAAPAPRAPVAAPTPSSMPRRDVGSRYMNFAHSDRFLEERQRNVARRQELAARSQQNAQTRLNAGARSTPTPPATNSALPTTRAVASRLTAFENDPRWLAQVAENRARADRVRAARKPKATPTTSS